MTPNAIWNEYLAREAEANKPGGPGADVNAIVRQLAKDAGMTYEEVLSEVIVRTLNRSGG